MLQSFLSRLRITTPAPSVLLWRANATLRASASTASPPPTSPPKPNTKAHTTSSQTATPPPPPPELSSTTQGRRRRNKTPIPPRRPPISVAAPRKWNRPLAEGVLPAYDLALKLIRTDGLRVGEEAQALERRIGEVERQVDGLRGEDVQRAAELDAELEKMREKLGVLSVQSDINLPEVRWSVANAMVDMTKPVHRYLMEQKWRKDGGLDLLMERVHQMKVVPDVLPDLHPSIDMHLTARTPTAEFRRTQKSHVPVEPGVFLLPEQTIDPPALYANVFHTDTRLYTMLLVDPDVPDEGNQSFTTFLHWLKPNIPLSATHRTRIPALNTHTHYIPPHPQRGTPYHRYVLLLLPQPPRGAPAYTLNAAARVPAGHPTSMHLDVPVVSAAERRGFDVRAFMRRWGYDGVRGGGAHVWREVWDGRVSVIYEDVLKEDEPWYGRPQRADPYEEVKQAKRYV